MSAELDLAVAKAVGDYIGVCLKPFPTRHGDWTDSVCGECGQREEDKDVSDPHDVPINEYSTRWADAGPLVDRYGITVEPPVGYGDETDKWRAMKLRPFYQAYGETSLEAICNLVLALSAANALVPVVLVSS